MNIERKILRIKDVLMVTSLKRSTLLNLINEGKFPAPFKLTNRCIGWSSISVNEWCDSKLEKLT